MENIENKDVAYLRNLEIKKLELEIKAMEELMEPALKMFKSEMEDDDE